MSNCWKKCLDIIEKKIKPQDYKTWILPLKASEHNNALVIMAKNQFVKNWILTKYEKLIVETILEFSKNEYQVEFDIYRGEGKNTLKNIGPQSSLFKEDLSKKKILESKLNVVDEPEELKKEEISHPELVGFDEAMMLPSNNKLYSSPSVKPVHRFDNFIAGKSNEVAKAASVQVSENPGISYNPLVIYGGPGLGKTHLLHAIGNEILNYDEFAKIIYVTSEQFVRDMVDSFQTGTNNEFKEHYRSADILLVDDIQFLAGKTGSQEEFFHTFNSLSDDNKQVVLTCDVYPKDIIHLEERLKSRFAHGLTVSIDLPDLETRVAILLLKATELKVRLSSDIAFFIAKHIRSNVRELEGALKRVITTARVTKKTITSDFVKETLKDIILVQARVVKIENIQKMVADYFHIKVSELLSKVKTRSIARPRQIAMALTKELTNHSLPEIGYAFGGRDHTTVLHAVRNIKKLQSTDLGIEDSYQDLKRKLSS